MSNLRNHFFPASRRYGMETHGAPRSFTQIRQLPSILILSVLWKRENTPMFRSNSLKCIAIYHSPYNQRWCMHAFPCKLHRNSNTDKEARSQSIKKARGSVLISRHEVDPLPLSVCVCVCERERLAREHHRFEGARRPPSEGVIVCMVWRGLLAGRWLLDSTLPGELFHLSFVWTVAWLTYQNSTISFLRVRVTNKIVQF